VSPGSDALEQYYSDINASVPIEEAPSYESLVVPNGNQGSAVHRWFHLKEAFSSDLLLRVVNDAGLAQAKRLRVLDPYSGAGTTATSVAEACRDRHGRNASVYGLETNGFLHLVGSSKLAAMQEPSVDFGSFSRAVSKRALSPRAGESPVPALSTFSRTDAFAEGDLRQLLRLKYAILEMEMAGAAPLDIALSKVALGSIVESVSGLRRDGRTLRRAEKRNLFSPTEAFKLKTRQILEDMTLPPSRALGRVMRGDGRRQCEIDGRFAPFDLILFSPPYPNNIDYTEVYKLENWLLDFITDQQGFRDQRLRSVYSHPSLLRTSPLPHDEFSPRENIFLSETVQPLLDAIPRDRYAEARKRMFQGYVADMYMTLCSSSARLSPTGCLVYVVGNSAHGSGEDGFVVAADLLLAKLGDAAGLRVQKVAVARHLKRRVATSDYLRESVVFLRPR
jgi:hypothetical protein